MNPLAKGYQNKNTTKQAARKAVEKSEANQSAIAQMQQMVLGMSYKLYELETKLQKAENVARIAETRSLALQRILIANSELTETHVNNEIMTLQAADFDEASAKDDASRGLTKVEGDAVAEIGQHAIMTLSFYKNGVELMDERIVRSKVELGKKELLGEMIDTNVVGMKIGETKEIDFTLGDRIDRIQITLLGLRNAPQAAQEEDTSEDNSVQN